MIPDGLWRMRGVQQQRRPGGGDAEYVEALEEAELVARDEVRLPDQVGRAHGSRTEAQVRHGDRTGLLRVVHEVALPEAVVVLGQDLDRVLVRPHRAVGAEAVEHGPDLVGGLDVEVVRDGQRGSRDVVDDADREMAARRGQRELVQDGAHHRGRELLRGEPVSPARDHGGEATCLRQRRDHVEVERLAERPGLLGPIEHGDGARRRRKCRHEIGDRERAKQPHLQDPDALAAGDEPLDGRVRRLRPRSHQDDDTLRLRMPHVVEQAVRAAGASREPVHDGLRPRRAGSIEEVASLARLEERVRVLRRAA